jgi:hypothetical protein
VVIDVKETDWGIGLLLLIQVVLLVVLPVVDATTLDPLTGGTPMLSFGPVMNWGLFRARGVATTVTVVVMVVMEVLMAVELMEEMVVEEMVVVVVVEVEVLVGGEGTA